MAKPSKEPTKKYGAAKKIKELFLDPLFRIKDSETDINHFLGDLFDLDNRPIDYYGVKGKIKLPGLYKQPGNERVRMQGAGPRDIEVGAELMIRSDNKNGVHDIEYWAGRGSGSHIYELTDKEFKSIKSKLEKLPNGSDKRRKRLRQLEIYYG